MNCFKFISRYHQQSYAKKHAIRRFILNHLKSQYYCTFPSSKIQKLNEEDEFLKKIIYNEVLQKSPKVTPEREEPLILKYLMPENNITQDIKTDIETEKEVLHFPYEVKHENDESNVTEVFSETVKNFTPLDDEKIKVPEWKSENYQVDFKYVEKPIRWVLEDEKDVQQKFASQDVFKFGSANPNARVSYIPCGGCGAMLHCNNPKMPGFIPAELFETKNKNDLLGEKCQRCHFLKEFNVALGVNVSPSEFQKLISSIRDKEALAMIMVDILDFPCSIFPEIFELIGPNKPIVIVANKVDLLIQEGPMCEKNFKQSLLWSLRKQKINLKNVEHVHLISAKTGYGIEKLIDLLFHNWGNKGDIYLIGCTNVGKSSLFNALIQSDFCKVKAIHLLQRATISAWPGTTLNLLKFPIMKPVEWRLKVRSRRLLAQIQEEKAFKEFRCLGQNIHLEQIPLQEYVGRTFLNTDNPNDLDQLKDSSDDVKRKGLNPNIQDFAKGYWFYDTPGVVHQDQIVNFLTAQELLLTVPNKMLLPRNFRLRPGTSLFIGGLARLDYINGADLVWFTVYASMELPTTVTRTTHAEEVYQKLLGTPYFRVPVPGKERLSKWPTLLSKKIELEGKFSKFLLRNSKPKGEKLPKDSDADVVLSSAGWVAVSVPPGFRCELEAWTPQGKGIYVRDLPIIRRGYTFRGPQIPGTPAFKTVMKEVNSYSFSDAVGSSSVD